MGHIKIQKKPRQAGKSQKHISKDSNAAFFNIIQHLLMQTSHFYVKASLKHACLSQGYLDIQTDYFTQSYSMKLQFRLDLLREDPRSILKLYILGHDLIWSQFEPTINQFHPKLKQSKLNVPPTSKEVLDRLQLKSSPILFGPLTFLVPKKFGRKKFGPMKFGPNESWSPRNLVPTLKSLYGIFMQGPTFLGTKFLQAQSFQGPKMSGTISVTAL